ncbi:hypothetical protein BGX28_003862 [Mortierella sp. GBA30]|nr:hypothetical protein BGX28_003862 [Mortierella sp. GBA30]
MASLQMGFVLLPESALLDIFYSRNNTKTIIQRVLQDLGNEDGVMSKKKERVAEDFKYKNAAMDYVHILTYDTKDLRPKTATEAQERELAESDELLEHLHGLNEELDIEEGFVKLNDLNHLQQHTMQQDIASSSANVIEAQQHVPDAQWSITLPASTSQSRSTQQTTSYRINWRQTSKLLENTQEKSIPSSLPRSTQGTRTHADPEKVTRKFLYRLHALFRHALQDRKKEMGIDKIERDSNVFTFTLREYF